MTSFAPDNLPLSPAACGYLSGKLKATLDHLKANGVRVNPLSRPEAAARLLKEVDQAGRFPLELSAQVRIGNALRLAIDLRPLGEVLREGIPVGLREVLKRAMGGTLDDIGATPALQAQSTLLVGVAVAASGRAALVPLPADTQTPDYVVDVDTAHYSIEVKRPTHSGRVQDSADDAASQLSAYGDQVQALYLDVTDCIGTLQDESTVDNAVDSLNRQVREIDDLLSAHVASSAQRYRRLGLTWVAAHPILWEPGDTPRPRLLQASLTTVNLRAYAGLVVDQSRRLMQVLEGGFRALGATRQIS